MNHALQALAAAVTAAASLALATELHHTVVPAGSVSWGPAPPSLPPGAQAAMLLGHPGKEGPFVLRLKFPAGYAVPPHRHSKDEFVTVISEGVDRLNRPAICPVFEVLQPPGGARGQERGPGR